MLDLVFILTRCVRKPEHNRLYKECYNCIRKHYNNPIYIIDDNSDQNMLDSFDMSGVEIINSEFPGSGELLPYYYMYHRNLGKKAIILQDSMFIQDKIDVDIDDYKFLWLFKSRDCIETVKDKILEVMYLLPEYDDMYDLFFDHKWSACFGSCMVITLDFLSELQGKTGLLNIIGEVKTRQDRCMLERLLGICVYYVKNKDSKDISILGSIFEQFYPWGLTYEEYITEHSKLSEMSPIIKVWNGR